VFGRNVKGLQRAHFSCFVDGNIKSVAARWLNVLAEDWTYLDESHQGGVIVEEIKNKYMGKGEF